MKSNDIFDHASLKVKACEIWSHFIRIVIPVLSIRPQNHDIIWNFQVFPSSIQIFFREGREKEIAALEKGILSSIYTDFCPSLWYVIMTMVFWYLQKLNQVPEWAGLLRRVYKVNSSLRNTSFYIQTPLKKPLTFNCQSKSCSWADEIAFTVSTSAFLISSFLAFRHFMIASW